MKILIPYTYDPSEIRGGGGITYVHSLIEVLLENEIDVKLIGVKLSDKETFVHPNFTFLPILNGTDNWWKFIFKLNNLVTKIDASQYIIHAHHPLCMYPFTRKYQENKKVCTFHGVPLDWVKINHPHSFGLISPFYKHVEKKIINRVDKVTTAGPYTKMRLIQRYPGLDLKEKIIPIPSGVDINKFKPGTKEKLKKELGLSKYEEIIIFVGRLAEIKNLNLLIKSYSLFKQKFGNSALLIVGKGEKVDNIKSFTKKLGLNNVIFTGTAESDMVVKYINCADLLALTSLFEASPTVVREALSCGVPIVSTNVGDLNSIITNPYLGEIVNSYDEKDFAEALINVINLTKESPDKVRDECRKLACENFSFEHVASKFISVYKELYIK